MGGIYLRKWAGSQTNCSLACVLGRLRFGLAPYILPTGNYHREDSAFGSNEGGIVFPGHVPT